MLYNIGYHLHIEKRDLGVETGKKLNPGSHLGKWPLQPLELEIQPDKQNNRVQRPTILEKSVCQLSLKMPHKLCLQHFFESESKNLTNILKFVSSYLPSNDMTVFVQGTRRTGGMESQGE